MGFKTLRIIFFLAILVIGTPTLVFAVDPVPEAAGGDNTGEEEPPIKTPVDEAATMAAYKASVESSVNGTFNKIGTTDPKQYIGRVITGAMGVLGSITLIMFVYSGFLWMTAAGDAGKSEKARDILVWSSLGLLVIFSSYAIVRFVFDIFPKI